VIPLVGMECGHTCGMVERYSGSQGWRPVARRDLAISEAAVTVGNRPCSQSTRTRAR